MGSLSLRKRGKKTVSPREGSIKIIQGNYIKLPRIGIVKTYCILPSVPVKNVRRSKRAGDWYISFKYECQLKPTPKSGCDPATTTVARECAPSKRAVIGVDVGINTKRNL